MTAAAAAGAGSGNLKKPPPRCISLGKRPPPRRIGPGPPARLSGKSHRRPRHSVSGGPATVTVTSESPPGGAGARLDLTGSHWRPGPRRRPGQQRRARRCAASSKKPLTATAPPVASAPAGQLELLNNRDCPGHPARTISRRCGTVPPPPRHSMGQEATAAPSPGAAGGGEHCREESRRRSTRDTHVRVCRGRLCRGSDSLARHGDLNIRFTSPRLRESEMPSMIGPTCRRFGEAGTDIWLPPEL